MICGQDMQKQIFEQDKVLAKNDYYDWFSCQCTSNFNISLQCIERSFCRIFTRYLQKHECESIFNLFLVLALKLYLLLAFYLIICILWEYL